MWIPGSAQQAAMTGHEIEHVPELIEPDEVIPPTLVYTLPPDWMKRLFIDEWKWRRSAAIDVTSREVEP